MDKLVVAALVVLPWSTLAYGQVAVDHEEFVGPFPSWANVKTDFGAIGDGSADDTEAFQKALDTFQQKSNVLFLPAGVYRITRTLTMTNRQCLSLLGRGPSQDGHQMGRGGRRYHAAVQRRLLRQVRAHHVERQREEGHGHLSRIGKHQRRGNRQRAFRPGVRRSGFWDPRRQAAFHGC